MVELLTGIEWGRRGAIRLGRGGVVPDAGPKPAHYDRYFTVVSCPLMVTISVVRVASMNLASARASGLFPSVNSVMAGPELIISSLS